MWICCMSTYLSIEVVEVELGRQISSHLCNTVKEAILLSVRTNE